VFYCSFAWNIFSFYEILFLLVVCRIVNQFAVQEGKNDFRFRASGVFMLQISLWEMMLQYLLFHFLV